MTLDSNAKPHRQPITMRIPVADSFITQSLEKCTTLEVSGYTPAMPPSSTGWNGVRPNATLVSAYPIHKIGNINIFHLTRVPDSIKVSLGKG